jgi:GNAT superfamily N-acetyltransferase
MVNKALVDCIECYWDFVRVLRNKNIGFVEQVIITTDQQNQYMLKHKDNYKVCLFDNRPVGFIGVVDNDIRFAVAQQYKNKGVGKWMLQQFPVPKNTIGKVKKDNLYSRQLFLSCNWTEIASNNKDFYMFKK